MRLKVWSFTACVVAVVAGGCAEPEPALFPVSGVVLYNDQPIPKAKLVFHPQFEGPGWMPVAIAAVAPIPTPVVTGLSLTN